MIRVVWALCLGLCGSLPLSDFVCSGVSLGSGSSVRPAIPMAAARFTLSTPTSAESRRAIYKRAVVRSKRNPKNILSLHQPWQKSRAVGKRQVATTATEVVVGAVSAKAGAVGAIQLALSRAMGYTLMCGSFLLEVPQIVKILVARSAEGISAASRYWFVPLYTSAIIYHILEGYPFSCYGENVVILIQNLVIVALVWFYQKTGLKEVISVCGGFCALTAIQWHLPGSIRSVLIYANIPCLVGAYVPQIVENQKNKDIGQLSLSPAYFKCVGCAMRLFTTLTQIGRDPALIASFGFSFVLNIILIVQGFMYRKPNRKPQPSGETLGKP
ncbi:hypothetical protein AAMO2058_001672900 [Amorphochlora amoebiformis]